MDVNYPHTLGGWWPCEEIALISMIKDNYKLSLMAAVLDRSYYSVVQKVRHLKRDKRI